MSIKITTNSKNYFFDRCKSLSDVLRTNNKNGTDFSKDNNVVVLND